MDHLIQTVRYSQKEFESIQEVINFRNSAGEVYYKNNQLLENQKEKILNSNNLKKWEVNFDEYKLGPQDLAKNKVVAKYVMLPHQNQVLREMKNIFGYFNNCFVKELSFVSNSRAKRLIRSFGTLSSEIVENLEMVGLFYSSKFQFSQISRTS